MGGKGGKKREKKGEKGGKGREEGLKKEDIVRRVRMR